MSTVLTVVRICTSAMRVPMIAFALVAFTIASAQKAAADQSPIAQLNLQIAATLHSGVRTAQRPTFGRPFAFESNHFPVASSVSPLGRRFTLPQWAAPLAHADRLLSVHTGGFEFNGWGALVPRGVVRLKYTLRF
jgi:hypothetical protein